MACMGAVRVAVVAALVDAVRCAKREPLLTPPGGAGDAALAALRDRFARREIDRAEYSGTAASADGR